MALMGYEPRAIPAAIPETRIPGVEARIKALQSIRDEAAAAHELSRLRMADYITKKFEPFKLGQKVWLEAKNLKINTPSQKLSHKWEGPFEVLEVLSPLVYKLQLPKSWKIHPVFHASLLLPYKENVVHGPNFPQPPPDLIEGEEEWEVEAILNH